MGARIAIGLLLSPCIAGVGHAQCQEWLPGFGLRGMHGPVNAMHAWDPDGAGPAPLQLFFGGSFKAAGDTLASRIVAWDGENWSPLGAGFAGPTSTSTDVRAIVAYDGVLYAGGRFTISGSTSVSNIARWDGNDWAPMATGVDGDVLALAVHDGALFVGGSFSNAGGITAPRIARWNGASWSALGSGIPLGGSVNALASFGGELIAAGSFGQAGSVPVLNIARWNGSQWLGMGTRPGTVHSLTTHDGELIAGGGTAGGSTVTRWNGQSWVALGDLGGTVHALASYSGTLVACGQLSTYGVALWNGSAWVPAGSGTGPVPTSLCVFGGDLIAGGSFTNQTTGERSISRWNGQSWGSVTRGFSSSVSSLEVVGDSLVAAGTFFGPDDVRSAAIWSGQEWQQLGQALSIVTVVRRYGGELLVGGWGFLHRLQGGMWVPFASSFTGTAVNPNAFVSAIFDGPCGLMIGGNFASVGGVPAANIARWNNGAWEALGSGTNNFVHAVLEHDGSIYAGGAFTQAGGVSASRIARWTGSAWEPLGSGMNGAVNALAVHQGSVVAGGQFSVAGGIAANGIARWTGSGWEPMFNISSFSHNIRALLVDGNDLYIAGTFGGGTAGAPGGVIRWDGAAVHTLHSGLGVLSGTVAAQSLALYNGELIVGGSFDLANGQPSACFARWAMTGIPWFAEQPQSVSVAQGGIVSLTAEVAYGYEGASLQWMRNGAPIGDGPGGASAGGGTVSGATASHLQISAAQPGDAGIYACIATTACGSTTSLPATVSIAGGQSCYANCDGSTAAPVLNVADFGCFLNKFASGDPYANCDGSTSVPVLNVADFGCFLNKFAAGCL